MTNPPTTIETERLRIVPFGNEHLTQRYVSWLQDPDVVRFSEQRYRTHTLESCAAYFRSLIETGNLMWALVERDPNLGHIGNINTYLDPRHNLADIGIMIGERAVWGKGYGTEAWRAVMAYLFDVLGVRKISAGTLSTNRSMIAIMEHCAMVPDGRRVRHYVYEGEEVDTVHAAAFRDSWPPSVAPAVFE